jgi:hypothetical protein
MAFTACASSSEARASHQDDKIRSRVERKLGPYAGSYASHQDDSRTRNAGSYASHQDDRRPFAYWKYKRVKSSPQIASSVGIPFNEATSIERSCTIASGTIMA